MTRRLLILPILAASVFAFVNPTYAQKYKWDLSNEHAASTLSGIADAKFAELVKAKSGGQIQITVHYGKALGYKSSEHFTAVEDGSIQLASTPFARLSGIDPIFELQSLPFLQPSIDEAHVFDDILRPYYQRVLSKSNQLLLHTVPWLPQGFWAGREINGVADLKGLRIRTIDRAAAETLKRAGADAIQMSWADVIPAAATGSINAAMTSAEGGVSAKLWEVGLKYFNNVSFTLDVSMTHVNRKAFYSLPDDLQLAVLSAAAETEAFAWNMAKKRAEELYQQLHAAGGKARDQLPPEFTNRLREAAGPVIGEWKNRFGSARADEILAIYFARTKK